MSYMFLGSVLFRDKISSPYYHLTQEWHNTDISLET